MAGGGAGVVDQDIDPAQPCDRRLGQLRDLRRVGDIAGDGQGAPALGAQLLGDPLDLGAAAGAERHIRAGHGQRQRDRAADAAPGAGDDGAATVEGREDSVIRMYPYI